MERQRTERDPRKPARAEPQKAGRRVGDRELPFEGDKTEDGPGRGLGRAMDAIREVVEKEK